MAGWGAAAAALALPALAMLVTDEVNWGAGDFAMAAMLLVAAGLGLEATARLARRRRTGLAVGAAILLAVLLVWAELAVGVLA